MPECLLSIGIVAEDGRELYLENREADITKALPWVREHVFTSMTWKEQTSHHDIRLQVLAFCNPEKYGKPEFWAYYADYDWVVMCQLFGRMIDLPPSWPMYCRDFKQQLVLYGNPTLKKLPESEAHNALNDAKWLKGHWERLHGTTQKPQGLRPRAETEG